MKPKFPSAVHGACIYHLGLNIKRNFKNDAVHPLFYTAAKAYRVREFERLMHQIRLADIKIGKYLEEAGFQKWARSHFNGKRYNIMTTNIAECLNGVLRNARELPIMMLVEYLRNLFQKWFYDRRSAAANMTTNLTTWAEDVIQKSHERSLTYSVHAINCYEYNVGDGDKNGVVNLHNKTCTCRKFDLDQLPCSHALAAARHRSLSFYTLCSRYYTSEALVAAYADSIYPVGHEVDWNVPMEVRNRAILPPIVQRTRGRLKKNRILSAGEDKVKRKCGRCGEKGHNRQKCHRNIPLHPPEPSSTNGPM